MGSPIWTDPNCVPGLRHRVSVHPDKRLLPVDRVSDCHRAWRGLPRSCSLYLLGCDPGASQSPIADGSHLSRGNKDAYRPARSILHDGRVVVVCAELLSDMRHLEDERCKIGALAVGSKLDPTGQILDYLHVLNEIGSRHRL